MGANKHMTTILIGALLIGITLGLLGSGGSAITVPVLVYLVGHGAKESIAESMAIVGLISVAAAIPYARAGQIDWRSVWYFGIPGMAGTFAGAWLGGLSTDALQLIVFGVVLFVAAYSMLRKTKPDVVDEATSPSTPNGLVTSSTTKIPIIAIEGLVVGIVTGFVGVGGGFLIVPALVILGKLPMRLAIGTSLVIIAAKAAIGFAKYEHYLVTHQLSANWNTILVFTLIGVVGSLLGKAINERLDQHLLQSVFGVFLIVLGSFVTIHEGMKWAEANPTPTETLQQSNSNQESTYASP